MTTYKLVWDGSVIKDGATLIPNLSSSSAWQEYLAWLAGGGVPTAADPEPLAPYQTKRIAAKIGVITIPNWATWTQSDFDNWCNINLMTNAQIDASTLSAALKTNVKAINLFVTNGGKLLIYLRDFVMIINGNS